MKKNNEISRRDFSKNLAKLLVFGGLTNFGLSSRAAVRHTGKDCPGGRVEYDECKVVNRHRFIETDYCPGGGPTEDECEPQKLKDDACPGEKMPQDQCSPSGAREVLKNHTDDECDTGFSDADICDNTIEKSDQCPAQNPTTDVCNATQSAKFDVCYSGLQSDDECDFNGGKATDECPGGGFDRDNCYVKGVSQTVVGGAIVTNLDSEGDECSAEGGNPLSADSCAPRGVDGLLWPEDQCGYLWSADVCYEGTNAHPATLGFDGGQDICMGSKLEQEIRGHGGDTCLDGSAAQDDCGGVNGDYNGSQSVEYDVCLPSAAGEKDDLCGKVMEGGIDIGSPDYCFNGLPNSDECKPSAGDEDECPGGMPEVDECIPGAKDPDECPGGGSLMDECTSGMSDEDECPGHGPSTDVCLSDVRDSDECEIQGVLGSDGCSANDTPDGCKTTNSDYVE